MKQVKVIFIAAEIAALISVVCLAFCETRDEEMKFFQGMYISLCALLAVVFQREQQSIEWYEDEEEETV